MTKTWDTQIERIRQSQSEALALRRELARQEASPEGQIRLQLEQNQARIDELNRQLGAQAMIEAQKLQSTIPGLRTETALLMATRGETNP